MNKLLAGIALCLATTGAAHAQFYFKDIISNSQLLAEMASYKENKIRNINIKSFEDDGEPSDGFLCEKTISKDYRKSEVFTQSNLSGPSLLTSFFNEKGKLVKTTDSSLISVSNNTYYYDEQDRIKNIVSTVTSSDDDFKNVILEEHIYEYNDKNMPTKMTRVRNKYDSTVILFLPDEKNNIAIEKDTRNGRKYFYYYDDKNRLTDIVHTNEFKEKLLPDYLFEYNASGQLVQMTSTEEGGSYYYVWKYSYENGLRSKEKLYSKERRLMGSISYEYK